MQLFGCRVGHFFPLLQPSLSLEDDSQSHQGTAPLHFCHCCTQPRHSVPPPCHPQTEHTQCTLVKDLPSVRSRNDLPQKAKQKSPSLEDDSQRNQDTAPLHFCHCCTQPRHSVPPSLQESTHKSPRCHPQQSPTP